jgi:hypothetical protein
MHPYSALPPRAFWKTAVADRSPFAIEGLWQPKFPIGRDCRILTAGSCFAQHISRALAARGYAWIDAEPAPPQMSPEGRRAFHYGTFSFRTGNIYTANMLRQWLVWAYGESPMPEVVWEKDGRFYDPFRPGIEPGGFVAPDEVLAARAVTLEAIRRGVAGADLFVFTLGLTEAWAEGNLEYALCPGTVAGDFDPGRHRFVNHRTGAIRAQMTEALRILRAARPGLRMLLTVSPVPLTATASGGHALTATVRSKSVLRAVAGELAEDQEGVDYFPSYEIITAPPFRGMFYGPNQRTVDPAGVAFVMDSFFHDQSARFGDAAPEAETPPEAPAPEEPETETEADLRCEEEILGAFAPR